jgi:hypothetical protein
MHKFVGGVQSPGVLVAKKQLFRNAAPHVQGGGTVFFVTDTDHRYVKEVHTYLGYLRDLLSMAQVGPLRECQVVASTLLSPVLVSIRRQLSVAYASGMHSGMTSQSLHFSLLAGSCNESCLAEPTELYHIVFVKCKTSTKN